MEDPILSLLCGGISDPWGLVRVGLEKRLGNGGLAIFLSPLQVPRGKEGGRGRLSSCLVSGFHPNGELLCFD